MALIFADKENMNIVATENDTDKLELAANCAWVKENLKYVLVVSDEEMEGFDVGVRVKDDEIQVEIAGGESIRK